MTTVIENAKIIINSQDDYLIISDEPLPLDFLNRLKQVNNQAEITGEDGSEVYTLEYQFPSEANVYIWSPPEPGKPQVRDAVPLDRVE